MEQKASEALVKVENLPEIRHAIELWAEANTRPETYDRPDKVKDKIQAVSSFFAFIKKHPASIRPEDVIRWRQKLDGKLLSPATVYARVSRVSAFYKWLMAIPGLGERILFNPAAPARPRAPRPYQSERTRALTDDQMNDLLEVVETLAETGSIVGKRDYALTIFYFFTGLRRNEVTTLRGKDLEFKDDGSLVINYKRKGGKFTSREVRHPLAQAALLDYLQAAGRLSVLNSTRPVWTRHDRAGKPGAQLSSRSYVENLKVYAKQAGINHIHLHQTRHTYARIVAEETGSYLETQEALDHENAATTRVYVERITIKKDKHSDRIAGRLRKRKVPI